MSSSKGYESIPHKTLAGIGERGDRKHAVLLTPGMNPYNSDSKTKRQRTTATTSRDKNEEYNSGGVMAPKIMLLPKIKEEYEEVPTPLREVPLRTSREVTDLTDSPLEQGAEESSEGEDESEDEDDEPEPLYINTFLAFRSDVPDSYYRKKQIGVLEACPKRVPNEVYLLEITNEAPRELKKTFMDMMGWKTVLAKLLKESYFVKKAERAAQKQPVKKEELIVISEQSYGEYYIQRQGLRPMVFNNPTQDNLSYTVSTVEGKWRSRGSNQPHKKKSGRRPNGFLIDSGATVNVVRSRYDVEGFIEDKESSLTLKTAEGAEMYVKPIGTAIGLGRVAECPDAAENLLSALEVSANGPWVISYDSGTMGLTNKLTGETMGGMNSGYGVNRISKEQHRRVQGDLQVISAVLELSSESDSDDNSKDKDKSQDSGASDPGKRKRTSAELDGNTDESESGTESEEEEEEHAGRPVSSEMVTSQEGTPEEVRRAEQARYLHVCEGHPSDESLTWALDNGLVLGTPLTGRDVRNASRLLGPCLTCRVAKTRRRSRYTDLDKEPPGKIGEMLYADIHPLPEKSVGGYTCLLISLDKYSGMIHVIELISKHVPSLQKAFKE